MYYLEGGNERSDWNSACCILNLIENRLDMKHFVIVIIFISTLHCIAFHDVEFPITKHGSCCHEVDSTLFCFELAKMEDQNYNIYSNFPELNSTMLKLYALVQGMELQYYERAKNESSKTTNIAKNVCENFHFDFNFENRNVPILFWSQLPCSSFGNNLGFYYELLSFCLKYGMGLVRVDLFPDNYGSHNDHCNPDGNMSSLLKYLPKFVLPLHKKEAPVTSWKELCDTIPLWPWTSSNNHFYRNFNIVHKLNMHMVHNYLRFSQHHEHSPHVIKEEYVNYLAEKVKVLSPHSLAIHFRCSDNLINGQMGLIPFSQYIKIFRNISNDPYARENLKEIIVYTDVWPTNQFSEQCTYLLQQFKLLLKSPRSPFSHLPFEISWTNAVDSFVLMAMSKYLICSASTFCFFAAINHGHSYIPSGWNSFTTLIVHPFNVSIDQYVNMTLVDMKVLNVYDIDLRGQDKVKYYAKVINS